MSIKDTLLNWTFTIPVKSLKGILLVKKGHTNLDIENISITIEGVNNMLYDKGMKNKDIYLHGTGMNLRSTSEGVTLAITRKAPTEDKKLYVQAYLFTDAAVAINDQTLVKTQW